MRHLIASDTFMQEYKMAAKVDALNLIDTLRDKVKELSLRTLIQCTKIRASTALNKWHDLAEYTICG
jgi:hypothetical protein